jgi:hypothetical protein
MARWPRRADWLAALALLGLDLSAYGRLLNPAMMLADYDAHVYFYPLRAYAAAAVQEGRLPLWNPSSFLGVPFIANPQTSFFYPFSALFLWLPVPHAYGLNLALHVLLAGLGLYAFCRVTLEASPPAAFVGGIAFMLGGVLSGQYGHLNQVSAAAWLPLVLLLADQAVARASFRLTAAAGGVVGLQLLAGHPQQSYMTLLAVVVVCLWRAAAPGSVVLGENVAGAGLSRVARAVAVLGCAATLGSALAAVQLIPTAELAANSIRGGGLSYREAIANSLWPWLVARALLPGFVNDLGSTELLGYVGIVPLLLATVALGGADWRRLALGLPLVVVGLALALGGANPVYSWLHTFVPGFSSFRAPARWLLLYGLGAACLAAVGLEWLLRNAGGGLSRRQWQRLLSTFLLLAFIGLAVYLGGVRAARWLQFTWAGLFVAGLLLAACCALPRARPFAAPALLTVASLELWAAGADLAPRRPVPLEAYAQPRDSTLFLQPRLGGGRFLSIASEDYELKEAPDYRDRYSHLPEQVLSSFLIAAKRNEVLTPNLNLLYRIDDADGYDGGLLPLRSYLQLAAVLVPPERLRSDGALISRLESLPSRSLMDLLNLSVVLAGRSKDAEDGGVEYDRSILASLGPGERLKIERVPRRAYTALGLISSTEDQVEPDGSPVARLEITATDGTTHYSPIVSGRDTAPGRLPDGAQTPEPLKVLRPWSWAVEDDPVEYLTRVSLPPVELGRLAVVNVSSSSRLNLRAISLIDERDGQFTPLVLDDGIERAAFFELKVYEYPRVLPRAYMVHRAFEADHNAALEVLGNTYFEPRLLAVVEPGAGLHLEAADGLEDSVEIVEARPELIRVRASSSSNAFLVHSEAFYPGWKVTIDGQPGRLIRTNVHFRGVEVPAGGHEVVFSYEPDSIRWGALISGLSVLFTTWLLLGAPSTSLHAMMRGRWR